MNIFSRKPPWYAGGLAFECADCGGCCAGPEEGFVWVTEGEIAEIADFLDTSVVEFRRKYVRRDGRRLSLTERRENKDCVFIEAPDDGGRKCAIYPVRPTQCRTWPFWPSNLRSPGAWAYAGQRCVGINRGVLLTMEEIEVKRDATRE